MASKSRNKAKTRHKVSVNTYINPRENVYKSTVVIGRPAKCLEDSEPFRAQCIAAGSQLGTQARNIIQPITNPINMY